MKQNKIQHNGKRNVLVILAIVFVIGVAAGVMVGYNRLRDLWLEQCEVRDIATQVTITAGKMVKEDVIAENFGIRKGANLALIDFEAKREEILKKIPNLRTISISRKLPDKVMIATEERSPIARMNVRGRKSETGRVTDVEGMVFLCQRGTSMLPIIREPQAPGTGVGHELQGRARTALKLIDLCREPAFAELGLLEVDISKADFLTVTLGNYSTAKIAWEGMDDPDDHRKENLVRQLTHLRDAIRTRLGATTTVIWNATDPSGRIYADTKGTL